MFPHSVSSSRDALLPPEAPSPPAHTGHTGLIAPVRSALGRLLRRDHPEPSVRYERLPEGDRVLLSVLGACSTAQTARLAGWTGAAPVRAQHSESIQAAALESPAADTALRDECLARFARLSPSQTQRAHFNAILARMKVGANELQQWLPAARRLLDVMEASAAARVQVKQEVHALRDHPALAPPHPPVPSPAGATAPDLPCPAHFEASRRQEILTLLSQGEIALAGSCVAGALAAREYLRRGTALAEELQIDRAVAQLTDHYLPKLLRQHETDLVRHAEMRRATTRLDCASVKRFGAVLRHLEGLSLDDTLQALDFFHDCRRRGHSEADAMTSTTLLVKLHRDDIPTPEADVLARLLRANGSADIDDLRAVARALLREPPITLDLLDQARVPIRVCHGAISQHFPTLMGRTVERPDDTPTSGTLHFWDDGATAALLMNGGPAVVVALQQSCAPSARSHGQEKRVPEIPRGLSNTLQEMVTWLARPVRT